MTDREPVTRGTLLYWAALVVLWAGVITVACAVFRAPESMGI